MKRSYFGSGLRRLAAAVLVIILAAATAVSGGVFKTMATGSYQYSISIMGGDAGETDIYAYVLVDGQEQGRAPLSIKGYGNWDTAVITGINVAEGQTVTVGISVKCQGEGAGAWGKIDDAKLNSEAN